MVRHAEGTEAADLPPASMESVCSRIARAARVPSAPVPSAGADEGPFFTDGPFTETKELMLGR